MIPVVAAVGGAVASIGSFLAAMVTKDVVLEVAKFIAYKVLLSGLLFVGLALVMRHFVLDLAFDMMAAVAPDLNSLSGGLSGPTLSLGGGVGAVASMLKVPECVSVLVSGYTVAMVRSFLPF